MTYEGSTSFVAAEDAVRSSKSSARLIGPRDSHRRTLQSECPKCCNLYIVSCNLFVTYSCNIVQEAALEARAIELDILSFPFYSDVTQRSLVASYRRFGVLFRSIF
jgi:hypothetical protein